MDYLSSKNILQEIYRAEKHNDWNLVEMLIAIQRKRVEINKLLKKVEAYKSGELWVTAGDD